METSAKGMRVLVTAGPTEEPIDPVRVITNSSSGKMGFAVARAARAWWELRPARGSASGEEEAP